MCEDHPTVHPGRTRRQVIAGGLTLAAAIVGLDQSRATRVQAAVRPVTVAPGLKIWPREKWGSALAPRSRISREHDVRVLLVHHSAAPNTWTAQHTMEVTYATHTIEKGWPDVCYNFFVARDGAVYEARAGSLDRPRLVDATGGSQGYSQLVCLLGDYTVEQPTPEARASLVKVLAWMADRSDVPTRRGSTTSFVSKGSNKFPAGAEVVSPTIAPHRQMSFTACPGDAFAPNVDSVLMRDVNRTRRSWARSTGTAVRAGHPEP